MKKLLLSLITLGFTLTVSIAKIASPSSDHVGQPNPYYQRTRSDSSQGYWKLYTDYNSRTTRVSFYSGQDELLYQEKIKDRYIKLSKRNIRQFDNLLSRLVDRNLVSSRVKSYDILNSNQWNATPQRIPSPFNEETVLPAPVAPTTPNINLEVVSSSQVKLSYLNPASERLLITLANDNFEFFYKRYSTLKEYAGLLNVSHLPSGTYRLEVDGAKKIVKYKVIIDQDKRSIKLNTVLNQFNP
ncbi:hypothetical protein IC229_18905 [Spirosoma sp. BT702]|uniref:Secretion system C-terminal sorting domain-containing protein n=1 Tax=Spirosoma profusum TaxID=2771354 RepID=A0A926XXI6_9BACT|nr:hypothetical protein [Spirosoma profusum]MBD2702724.1 hypothetical protein [Spirosoma profusum]